MRFAGCLSDLSVELSHMTSRESTHHARVEHCESRRDFMVSTMSVGLQEWYSYKDQENQQYPQLSLLYRYVNDAHRHMLQWCSEWDYESLATDAHEVKFITLLCEWSNGLSLMQPIMSLTLTSFQPYWSNGSLAGPLAARLDLGAKRPITFMLRQVPHMEQCYRWEFLRPSAKLLFSDYELYEIR